MNNLLKKSVKKYLETQDFLYEIQKLSNEIRVLSKKAITFFCKENIKEGESMIKNAEEQFKLINKIIKQNKDLLSQNFYKEAAEEYIEAVTFYNFLTRSKKEIPDFLKVEPEEVISGICDFTGELVRRAVTIASPRNFKEIIFYRETVENVINEIAKVGFQGKLRQKYNEAQRNLSKLEDIIYDIKLKI